MIIKRILNNNAVMILDANQQEVIIKGKGIAFNKSVGDFIDETKIEKKFTLDSQDTTRRYQEILVSIPDDCIKVSEEAIDIIKQNLDKKLSDKIYITLTDHISNYLERIAMGIVFDNKLLWDVKRIYKDEYDVALKVVWLMRKSFDIKVDNDEACFIALHIVNAELDIPKDDAVVIGKMIQDIYDIVESFFDLHIDKDSLEYSRFLTHLRFFFERIINKKSLGVETNSNVLQILKKSYPKQYQCVEKISQYVATRYQEPIDGELIYLMIHVLKLTT